MSIVPVKTENQVSSEVCDKLAGQIKSFGNRSLSIGLVAGLLWSVVALVLVVTAAVWFDLLWELPASARILALRVAIGCGLVSLLVFVWLVVRRNRPADIARQLDAVGDTGGEIAAGLNLAGTSQQSSSITAGLAELAVSRASETAGRIPGASAAPIRPISRAALAVGCLGAVLGLVYLMTPDFFSAQWNRFASPHDDTPPFSLLKITVEPGDTQVIYGEGIDIIATTNEQPVDDLQLVLVGDDGSQEVVPMFSESSHRWRSVLTRVVRPTTYFIRSGRSRTAKFNLTLVTIPEIENISCQIRPPEYTRLATTRGPIPDDGIAGLPGTRVTIQVTSNRPLRSGELIISDDTRPRTVTMETLPTSPNSVVAEFDIRGNGKFELTVTDIDGQYSRQKVNGSLVLLEDSKPFVRLQSPRQTSLATPEATIPVVIDAEDDYGISALYLFRSLNDSNPSPTRISIQAMPTRWVERSMLSLSDYGLEPGDVIKLFARVEDNDPASAKGSESPVHTIKIISQKEFEAIRRRQLGFAAVMSKYRRVQRELETLAKAHELLEKELQDQPDDGKPKQSTSQKVADAAERIKNAAEVLRQQANQELAIDVDKEINERLRKMADELDKIANEIDELSKQAEQGTISNAQLQKKLEKLRKKMGAQRGDFDRQVLQPMGDLSKAVKIMSLQNSFVQLVLRQRDLTERSRSLEDFENDADPDAKRRLRDFAEEQAELSSMLHDVLDAIVDAVDALPETEEFEELRRSAFDFVDAVDASDASYEMEHAELAFAQFSGGEGFSRADKAATILESFLSQCNGVQDGVSKSCKLRFNPSLGCPTLGNSMQQIAKMFGMNQGGQGIGSGGQGGFSQRRSTMDNVGLYGNEPTASQASQSGRGDRESDAEGQFFGARNTGRNQGGNAIGKEKTRAGSASGAIPSRYERRTGEYFRRITDEIDN